MRIRYLLEFAVLVPSVLLLWHWCSAVVLTLYRGRVRKCPRCSSRTRWSRMKIYDRVLPAFVLPRRCESCQYRFYAAHRVNYVQRERVQAARAAAIRVAAQTRPAAVGALETATAEGNVR